MNTSSEYGFTPSAPRDEGGVHVAPGGNLLEVPSLEIGVDAPDGGIARHGYGTEIDDSDVYKFLQHDRPLFHSYLEAVRERLD